MPQPTFAVIPAKMAILAAMDTVKIGKKGQVTIPRGVLERAPVWTVNGDHR